MDDRLEAIHKVGQSIWYDNLSRELLTSGELQRIVDQGVVGVTSNPTIFEKSITHSDAYDTEIRTLVERGQTVDDLYQALTQYDVQQAADLLLPVYERSAGTDGYVSLEVSPLLAHDSAGTIEEARRIFYSLGRKNLMIKVPATPAGITAIRTLISDGLNINVTLIFGLTAYQAVMDAYLTGLEDRLSNGLSVRNIASVASFFVSRVDTLVDSWIDEKGLSSDLSGKAAVANAKLAYAMFQTTFGGKRFAQLKQQGAMVQRPLWASTSVKNPHYPDLLYVDDLIGPDTVNTVPPATLTALLDHGQVARTVDQDLENAHQSIQALAAGGIDMESVAAQLLQAGLQSFTESFVVLRRSLAQKRARLVAQLAPSRYALGDGEIFKQRAQDLLTDTHAVPRLWAHDGTLWSDNPEVISQIQGALGWLSVPDWTSTHIQALRQLAESVRTDGMTDAVLLGMGGSSLVSEVLSHSFAAEPGYLRLHVLDSTSPQRITRMHDGLDLSHTLFIVASKSGTTTEAQSFYHYFWQQLRAITPNPEHQFIAITDPDTALAKEAAARNFRAVFLNPKDIGGRYSALSLFGMVSAALMGLDVEGLLLRAKDMATACRQESAELNPGIQLGTILGGLAQNGHDKITLLLPPRMGFLADWIEQLLAESTGKNHTGLIPIAHEPFGNPNHYSHDRVFVSYDWYGNQDHGMEQQLTALQAAGHPVVRLTIADRYGLAAEFFRWEMATAFAGKILGINPFDQPNVQESKENTKKVLEQQGSGLSLDILSGPEFDVLGEHLAGVPDVSRAVRHLIAQHQTNGSWVALMAYIDPSAEHWDRLEQIRSALLRRGLPSSVGFGPRFLHSTGQLHKGGPDSGIYLQIVSDAYPHLEIPDAPYDFSALIQAQAEGDLESLMRHQRPVLRIVLHDPESLALTRCAEILAEP